MKMVRFTRDMAPFHRGDRHAFPDHVAEGAVKDGFGEIEASVFDAQPAEPGQPMPKPGPKPYHTREIQTRRRTQGKR